LAEITKATDRTLDDKAMPDHFSEFKSTGGLFFDETGETIAFGITADEFSETRLAQLGNRHFGGGHLRCKLGVRKLLGQPFNVTFNFDGQRLDFVELSIDNQVEPAPGAWAAWTVENELARKAWHERWIEKTFGRPPEILAYVLPEVPRPIKPANPGPDHPRHLTLSWGVIGSYLDSRGGFAWMRVRYDR
jgi:hypothetical protein